MEQHPPIRLGILGAGVMGGYHVRTAIAQAGARVIGVYDADLPRADQVAGQYGLTAFATPDALYDAVDAVIIASPTNTHLAVARACLAAECHVLLEKPLAANPEDAVELAALSAQSDRVFMVGHVERFNPAFLALQAALDPDTLYDCALRRMSTAPGRDRSADVIYDLMIHDLDLVLACVPAPVTVISAVGHRLDGGLIDHVTALLRFANGATATLTASMACQERARRGRFYTRPALLEIDFAAREVTIQHFGASDRATRAGNAYPACLTEHLLVPHAEPLALEQAHFLHAIHTGTPPAIDAAVGLRVVQLAAAIQQCVDDTCREEAVGVGNL